MNTVTTKQTRAELEIELAALKARHAELMAAKSDLPRALTFRVSEKGALSVYGMGRFPVTLYKEQWAKLIDVSEEIKAFIAANDSKLKAKSDK
jgi:hypothetical protein